MNRGFLYGDGFFETIRITNNEIPLIQYHLERIAEAIDIYQFTPEFDINDDFIQSIKQECGKNGILRINFFRDGGGKYLPETNAVAFDYTFSPNESAFYVPTHFNLFAELYNAPKNLGSLALYAEPKPLANWMQVKSLSSGYYVLAALDKQRKNADYLILLNDKEEVCEELSSNLILIKGDDIFIPSLQSGGVRGATLRFIMKNYRIQITEKIIHPNELEHFDAIFSCKATTGINRIK
ncbi:MAG: hypothetical protein RLZZ337_332 [Bacteroidota bacterium]|jgi:branched-chain amino acid aminotransferase